MFLEPLLELLLDLATLHTGEDEASTCLTAVACSCLLALVTARGDTGKILSAVAALLMCPRLVANQTIQVSFHFYVNWKRESFIYYFFVALSIFEIIFPLYFSYHRSVIIFHEECLQ